MSDDPLFWPAFAAKLVFYFASLISVGMAAHAAFGIAEPKHTANRLAAGFATAAAALACGRLLLAAAEMGGGFAQILAPDAIGPVWAVQGPSLLAWTIGALILAASFMTGRPITGVLGAALLCLGFGLSGHAQATDDPSWAPVVVVAHVALGGFWVAAPLTLWPMRDEPAQAIGARTERFSGIAIFAAPLVFALGAALSLKLAGGVSTLISSDYGVALGAKGFAAVAALAIGAANKTHVSRALLNGRDEARAWLKATLAAEAALFAMAIASVSVATSIGPPS